MEEQDRPVCILSAQIVIRISRHGQYFDIVHVNNANVWSNKRDLWWGRNEKNSSAESPVLEQWYVSACKKCNSSAGDLSIWIIQNSLSRIVLSISMLKTVLHSDNELFLFPKFSRICRSFVKEKRICTRWLGTLAENSWKKRCSLLRRL